jgi:hypothetical protein
MAVLALLGAAAVVVLIVTSDGKPAGSGNAAGTTATNAATVRRRNLVATDTESGTLSYANAQTVYNRLSGTITWVPQVGQVIKPGHALFTVDNRPVLLLDGTTPAYRELTASDLKGPDVYELNRNLVALGYDPDGIVVDDEWQAATTAGVERMQYDLGETETGSLSLGQVVFLPGPQMIQTVSATVGSAAADRLGGADPALFVDDPIDSPTTGTSTTDSPPSATGTTGTSTTGTGPATTGADTDTTATGTTTTPTNTAKATPPKGTPPHSGSNAPGADNLSHRTLQALLRLIAQQQRALQAQQHANHPSSHPGQTPASNAGRKPASNSGKKPSSPSGAQPSPSASNNSPANGANAGGGAATAVMTTSSTKLVVTVDLSPSSQSEATLGERVGVELPDGSTVAGHVTAVSPVAQASSSGAGGSGAGDGSAPSTVPVTIVLDRRARGGGLDQASVSVNFVQSKARHVLSVPVTALLATSGSSFAVQEADRPHRLLAVTTGLFAAGYVEISGPGIHPGLKVTDSQG